MKSFYIKTAAIKWEKTGSDRDCALTWPSLNQLSWLPMRWTCGTRSGLRSQHALIMCCSPPPPFTVAMTIDVSRDEAGVTWRRKERREICSKIESQCCQCVWLKIYVWPDRCNFMCSCLQQHVTYMYVHVHVWLFHSPTIMHVRKQSKHVSPKRRLPPSAFVRVSLMCN